MLSLLNWTVSVRKGFTVFSAYCRLHLSTDATTRDVIRAAQGRLSPEGKGAGFRAQRHNYYRAMLEHHRQARHLHQFILTGEQ